jgi:quercetin dioxygenase-like cupin family protein
MRIERSETAYNRAMNAYAYPHTIENGGGEQLTFVRRVQDPSGDSLEVENLVKPGSEPPMHVHYYQEEVLTVRQGRIGHQRPEEPPHFARPGETVVFEPVKR